MFKLSSQTNYSNGKAYRFVLTSEGESTGVVFPTEANSDSQRKISEILNKSSTSQNLLSYPGALTINQYFDAI